MPTRIRKAYVKDAEGIANVHVDTMRTSYQGIYPGEFLSSLSYDQARHRWESIYLDPKSQNAVYVAEDDSEKIVGFVICGKDRDSDTTYVGEVIGLYVPQSMQGRGIGKQLLLAAVKDLKNRGFASMIIWVLADNPSRHFYEKLGGEHVQTREIVVGGKRFQEYGYGWKNLDSLAATAGSKENDSLGRVEVPLVREIRPEDYNAVDSIARALHPTWFTESALEDIAHAVRHEYGHVAIMNGIHVGFVTYRLSDDDETAELTWIGVHPDSQRKGVGGRLVEAVEQGLGSKGFKTLEVFTVAATVNYEPYALTRRFYHAIGFTDVRVELKGFPSGDDKLLLRKRLGTVCL